jgi:hypothetical protein
MTELEEKAIEVLVESPPNTDPFGRPVEDMASKLGLPIDEARTLTGLLLSERLIHIVTAEPASNLAAFLIRYMWERIPDA